jgi:outer membrane receptor protein involved in Fe transport
MKAPIAAAIALAILGSQAAVAGEASAPQESLEEITVTGSRIQQATGMTTPTPVAALSATELQAMAPSSVTAALTQLPQFSGQSATSENFGSPASGGFFNSPGGGSLNLRGLGTKRTLTLLDGRRMVPATAYGGPDVNLFPEQVMQRVEAVTGGASASYGTDAVSGVVNYILDTDMDGFRASAQTGFSERGDGRSQRYSLAFGSDLGSRSHLLFSAGYTSRDDIVGYDGRDWYDGCGLMQNPGVPANVALIQGATPPTYNNATYVAGNGGYSASSPRLVPACDLHSTQLTYDGLVTVGTGSAARIYELQSDGSAVPFNRTLPTTGPASTSGVMPGGGGQNFALTDTSLLPAWDLRNAFVYLDTDISDNVNVYVQGMYGEQSIRYWARVGDINSNVNQQFTVFRDNAFLPASLASIMDQAAVTSATMTRAGTREDWGTGHFENRNVQTVGTIGFKSTLRDGGFMGGWHVDGYAQYGKNKLDAIQEQGLRLDRIYLAMDAVRDTNGSIRCRVTQVSGQVPDCVPLNIFGRGNASAAAVDWIKGYEDNIPVTVSPFTGFDANGVATYGDPISYVGDENKHRRVTTEQTVVELTTDGKLFTGWAGDVSAAFGLHYRKESIDQVVWAPQGNTAADATYFPVWCPDNVVTTNSRCISQVNRGIRPPGNLGIRGVPANPYQNTVETQFSNVPFISGSFDVKEAFAEVLFPLLSDLPWMQDLNLQAAVRWADYEGSGEIWSYKAGLDAAFTDEIRLRGTYSHDTRAANIAERFDRTGGFTAPVTDPLNPPGWVNPTAVTTVSGGNPLVDPEEADTFTAGIVYRPNWAPGLDMSVDWMSVSLEGAIEQLPAQSVINQCYLDGDQDQCAKIIRDPTTNFILFIPQLYENQSDGKIEAIDAEIGYTRNLTIFGGNEVLGVRVLGTYLLENSTTSTAGVTTDLTNSVIDQYFRTKVNGSLFYSNGPFRWNLQARYIGGGDLNARYNQERLLGTSSGGVTTVTGSAVIYDVADNDVGSSVYWDTRLGYEIPVGDGTLEIFGNVNNLFDRDPPLVLGEAVALQTGGGFDVIGRFFTVGLNLRF